LLMPLATAALLGNQLTLIGTPTNLIIDDLLTQQGHPPFGFFTLTPYAAASLLLAMGWYWLMAQRTLPEKSLDEAKQPSLEEIEQSYDLRGTFQQVRVQPQSDLVGERLEAADLRQEQVEVIAVEPANSNEPHPAQPDQMLHPGDRLIVQGQPAIVHQRADQHGLQEEGTAELAQFSQTTAVELHLSELVAPYRSSLTGKTLAELDLNRRYGFHVLAINRQGETSQTNLGEFSLQTGDILLVQGSPDQIRKADRGEDLAVITEIEPEAGNGVTNKAKITLVVLGVVIVVVLLNWISLAVALLAASIVLILTGSFSVEQAYDSINAKIIVLLAGMLPLAMALQQTGVTTLLASWIAASGDHIGAYGALFLLYLCGTLMTQIAPNAVTAAVITPVALQLAVDQGRSPQTFAIAITFAVSASYLTPLISKVNLVVKSKGNYSLGDYLRNTLPIYVLQVAVVFGLLILLG
jgi:di/tricarboxylate transporter